MTDSLNDGPYSPAAAGRTISRDHIAFIYTSSEEMLNSTVSLIREGLESGELCLYISDLEDDQIIVQALREGHVDVDEAVEKGRLILSSKHEIYFQRGWFDPDWTIQVIRNLADIAASHGFTSMRMISDMRWTQDRVTGTDRWVDYEAKLSSLDLGVGLKTICQFDSEMLSSDALLSALMTHPRLECQGAAYDNMFFIHPERLREGDQVDAELEGKLAAIKAAAVAEAARLGLERDVAELSEKLKGERLSREEAERSLEEGRAHLRSVYERSSEWFWEIGPDGTYRFSSSRVTDLLGISSEEVIGRRPEELVDDEDAQKVASAIAQAMSDKAPINALEKKHRHTDGRFVYLEMSGVPVLDDRGNLQGYRGKDMDVTVRKTSEKAIDEHRHTIEEMTAELNARDVRIKNLEGDVEQLRKSSDVVKAEASALAIALREKEAETAHLAERTAALSSEISALTEQLQQAREVSTLDKRAMEEQAANVEKLKRDLAEVESALAVERERHHEAEAESQAALAALRDEISSRDAKMSEVQAALEAATSEAGDLRARIEALKAEMEAVQKERDALKSLEAERSEELNRREDELNAATDRAKRLSVELEGLRCRLADAERCISSRDEEIASHRSREEELVASLASREKEMEALSRRVEAGMEENARLLDDLRSKDRELMTLRDRLAAAEAEVAAMNGERLDLQTSLSAAEQELVDHRERLNALFRQDQFGIARIDPNGDMVDANDAFHRLLGQEPGALIGTNYRDHTHRDDLAKSAETYDLLNNGGGPVSVLKRYVRRNGGIATVDLALSPVNGPDGSPIYHMALAFDRTEEVSGPGEALESEPEGGKTNPDVARRLNDALTVILGGVTLAKEYVIPEGRMHGQLVQIERACSAAARLASELENASSGTSGFEESAYAPVTLVPGRGRIMLVDSDEAILEVTTHMLRHLGYDVDIARDGDEAAEVCRQAVKDGKPFALAIIGAGAAEDGDVRMVASRLTSEDPGLKTMVSGGQTSHPAMSDPVDSGFIGALPRPYTLEELSKVVSTALASQGKA